MIYVGKIINKIIFKNNGIPEEIKIDKLSGILVAELNT